MSQTFWSALLTHLTESCGHTLASLEAETGLSITSLWRWMNGGCPNPDNAAALLNWATAESFIRQNSPHGHWSCPSRRAVSHRVRVLAWAAPGSRGNPGAWLMAYFLDGESVEVDSGPFFATLTLDMLLDELAEVSEIRARELGVENDNLARELRQESK